MMLQACAQNVVDVVLPKDILHMQERINELCDSLFTEKKVISILKNCYNISPFCCKRQQVTTCRNNH